jgi:hypothetical protein
MSEDHEGAVAVIGESYRVEATSFSHKRSLL